MEDFNEKDLSRVQGRRIRREVEKSTELVSFGSCLSSSQGLSHIAVPLSQRTKLPSFPCSEAALPVFCTNAQL